MKIKSHSISLLITLLIVVLGVLIDDTNREIIKHSYNYIAVEKDSYNNLSIEDQIEESYLNNKSTYDFYAYTFGINIETLKESIKNTNKTTFNEYNLLDSTTSYKTIDESIFHYVISLEKENDSLFNRKYKYEKVSKEYIYGLIEYYCNIYKNVDVKTAKAIAYLESGNLSANNMMRKNNIFGGMNNHVLYRYPTIEYGVYSYIRLLSNGYYSKGLNTVETIGKKYNPTVINGKEVANPSWVSQVNSLLNKFDNTITIDTIDKLNALK